LLSPRVEHADTVSTEQQDSFPTQEPATPERPLRQMLSARAAVPLSLSVGDGFKFGCGFIMAAAIGLLLALLALALGFLLASLLGVPLPIAG
jgi:hypothetical protein